jgi:hypothetical protein
LQDYFHWSYDTEIRIGDNPIALLSNELCATVDFSGIYNCPNPLTGTYLGLRRSNNSISRYDWIEIRAYERPPMELTTSMMTTNDMNLKIYFYKVLSFSISKL